MKINLLHVDEFVKVNKLKEITSHVMYQRNELPHPDGLISNEIFGITTRSRKNTFAYINLGKPYLHPVAYKAINRIFRNIDKIINGELYYTISKEGDLIVDNENGETGIDWLYNNWEKIKWKKDEVNITGMRNERINLLLKEKKDVLFMKEQVVIPAFYRDIRSTTSGGETDSINNLYGRLIRAVTENKDDGRFDFQFHATDYNIQHIIVSIYDYFKQKVQKKQGLIRKYLMGKSVDYCTRTVITAPTYHANRPEDNFVDFRHTSIPISQICTLCYPFIFRWVKEFFEGELLNIETRHELYVAKSDRIIENVAIKNMSHIYNDKFYEKMIKQYQKDQESRFNIFPIESVDRNEKLCLVFSGRRMQGENSAELATITNRALTWTDVLYMACCDVVKDKHCLITRYPLLDEFGTFISEIRVSSTIKTEPTMVNGQVYKWYPVIDHSIPKHNLGSYFKDSVSFSNSYLEGLEGDYDGDQTTVKILFTQEANEECKDVMNRKGFFINSAGKNVRSIGKEAAQTFYVMTKGPYGVEKPLSKEDVKRFVNMKPEDFTFDFLVDTFGYIAPKSDTKNTDGKKIKPKYHPTDTLVLTTSDYALIKDSKPVHTTLGRLIYNKIMVEGLGFEGFIGYVNDVLTSSEFKAFDRKVVDALETDKIGVPQMVKYIDTRDWLGLQLHTVITTSFTYKVLVTPNVVKKRKEELFKQYREMLEQGDTAVMEMIEKELLDMMRKHLDGDIGMDLYNSGARGSVSNHLKNINIARGAILNPITGKYNILKNSYLDGLAKEDIPAHGNAIVTGSFPKAVGTATSGYLSKSLLAGLQTQVLGPKDSDCGSTLYRTVILKPKLRDRLQYRYVKIGNHLECLTPELFDKLIGKSVQIRSPLFCKRLANGELCNKCAGDFYYIVNKPDIGLSCSRIAESQKQMNLQKFHDNTIKTTKIDLNDWLIKINQ